MRFVINAVKPPQEITEEYGRETYLPVSRAKGTCKITDSKLSHYRPAAYRIAEATTTPQPAQLLSWNGEHRSLLKEGDIVEYRGTLELVSGEKGRYYQVTIGTAPGDYLKPSEAI